MYTARDGKNFGNHEMGKRYDSSRPKKSDDGEKEEKDGKGGEPEDMSDVVAEHGPAEHVVIHSHHSDGHVHKSEKHHDAESAHAHVSKAFDEEMPMSEPDGDEGGGEMAVPSIPGMRE